MKQIIVGIENWKGKDDKVVVKAVRKALQEIVNDGFRMPKYHYTDYDNTGIEFAINVKY